jgi:hypothetical protein
VVEAGKDRGLGPLVEFGREAMDVGGQSKEEGRDVLRYAGRGIACHVADRDASFFGGVEIDHIHAGGRDENEFQRGERTEGFGIQDDLVGDDHLGVLAARENIRGERLIEVSEGAEGLEGSEVDIAATESGRIKQGDVHGKKKGARGARAASRKYQDRCSFG